MALAVWKKGNKLSLLLTLQLYQADKNYIKYAKKYY